MNHHIEKFTHLNHPTIPTLANHPLNNHRVIAEKLLIESSRCENQTEDSKGHPWFFHGKHQKQ